MGRGAAVALSDQPANTGIAKACFDFSAWPKLFQNLRSRRETELAEQFPMHVVCSWIGRRSEALPTDDRRAFQKGDAESDADCA